MSYRSRVLCSRKRLLQLATGAATVGGTGELLVTVGSRQKSRVRHIPRRSAMNESPFGSRAAVNTHVTREFPAFRESKSRLISTCLVLQVQSF